MESQPVNPAIADIREYIRIRLDKLGITLTDFEMEALIMSADIDEDAQGEWTAAKYMSVAKTLLHKQIPELLLRPDVTEGGYSIKHNRDGIMAYYNLLCSELNLPNALSAASPRLTDKSYLW